MAACGWIRLLCQWTDPVVGFSSRLLSQVAKVSNHTGTHVTQVQKALLALKEKVKADKDRKRTDEFLAEAGRIGDDFLELEKFVNLNYMVCVYVMAYICYGHKQAFALIIMRLC